MTTGPARYGPSTPVNFTPEDMDAFDADRFQSPDTGMNGSRKGKSRTKVQQPQSPTSAAVLGAIAEGSVLQTRKMSQPTQAGENSPGVT